MSQSEQNHIIATIVENKPGVLFRVTNMIRRRGFNIESLSVGPLNDGSLARMTLVVRGDEKTVELVARNLHKLVEVIKVKRLNLEKSVLRELALIKIRAEDSKTRTDLTHYVRIFRGRIVDVSPKTMTVEITGDPKKINAFLELTKGLGIREVARTGIAALARGAESI